MKKLFAFMLIGFVAQSNANAEVVRMDIDVFNNPKFIQYSYAGIMESTLASMRQNNIDGINSFIKDECNTIADWYLPSAYRVIAGGGAGDYSSSVTLHRHAYELASRLSDSHPFPFGLETYKGINKIVSDGIRNGLNEYKISNFFKNVCILDLNPRKYKALLNSGYASKAISGVDKLVDKSDKSYLPLLSTKSTAPAVNVTKNDARGFDVAYDQRLYIEALISEDIAANLKSQNVDNWVVYKDLLDKKLNDFRSFISNGGSNGDYLIFILFAKVADASFDYSDNKQLLDLGFLSRSQSQLDKNFLDKDKVEKLPYFYKHEISLKKIFTKLKH